MCTQQQINVNKRKQTKSLSTIASVAKRELTVLATLGPVQRHEQTGSMMLISPPTAAAGAVTDSLSSPGGVVLSVRFYQSSVKNLHSR